MTSPIVSVVLPTFNRARLVGGTIDSIRSQTFADWELIVVDDGSTDDTSAVLRAATETDSRIQIVRQRNAGVAGAQNVGLNNARGEFIAFHGDDDFSHPSRLQKCVECMRENLEKDAVEILIQPFSGKDGKTLGMPVRGFTFFFRSAVLRSVGGFRAFFRNLDDGDLRLRLEERGIDYAQIDEVLYFIRRGDGHQHLANQLQLGFYAYAMLVSAHCRRRGLPDPVADGKLMNEVLAECNAVTDIVRDKKMTAQILRAPQGKNPRISENQRQSPCLRNLGRRARDIALLRIFHRRNARRVGANPPIAFDDTDPRMGPSLARQNASTHPGRGISSPASRRFAREQIRRGNAKRISRRQRDYSRLQSRRSGRQRD